MGSNYRKLLRPYVKHGIHCPSFHKNYETPCRNLRYKIIISKPYQKCRKCDIYFTRLLPFHYWIHLPLMNIFPPHSSLREVVVEKLSLNLSVHCCFLHSEYPFTVTRPECFAAWRTQSNGRWGYTMSFHRSDTINSLKTKSNLNYIEKIQFAPHSKHAPPLL